MSDLHDLSAVELAAALQNNDTDPVETTAHFLARVESLNPKLGAFVTVDGDRAMDRARQVRDEVPRTVPLWGLPVGVKDLWQTKGQRTTFGSRFFAQYVPDVDDEIVTTLSDAGTVSLGKTNTPEFGMPPYTQPLAGPISRSPVDPTRTAGGSSGGAAVAVAARMLPFAPGSDGGGSIRIPAACCGVVGIKPSRGMVPSGTGQEAPGGLAVNGPIARSVADAAFLLDALIAPRGHGEYPFALRAPQLDRSLRDAARNPEGKKRIAVMTGSPWEDDHEITIDTDSRVGFEAAVRVLAGTGHELEEITLAPAPGYSQAFQTVWHAGSATIPIPDEHLDALEALTAWSIRNGRSASAGDLVAALAVFTAFERSLIAQLEGFDAVVTPALAIMPPEIGYFDTSDPEADFAKQVRFTPFTSMANVAGLPSLSLPVAMSASGFPISALLTGKPGGEAKIVQIAAQLEAATGVSGAHRG